MIRMSTKQRLYKCVAKSTRRSRLEAVLKLPNLDCVFTQIIR